MGNCESCTADNLLTAIDGVPQGGEPTMKAQPIQNFVYTLTHPEKGEEEENTTYLIGEEEDYKIEELGEKKYPVIKKERLAHYTEEVEEFEKEIKKANKQKEDYNVRIKKDDQADKEMMRRKATLLRDDVKTFEKKVESYEKLIKNAKEMQKQRQKDALKRIGGGFGASPTATVTPSFEKEEAPQDYFYKRCGQFLSSESFEKMRKENVIEVKLDDEESQDLFENLTNELIKSSRIVPALKGITFLSIDINSEDKVLKFINNCFPKKLDKLTLQCDEGFMPSAEEYISALVESTVEVQSEILFQNFDFDTAELFKKTVEQFKNVRGGIHFNTCMIESSKLKFSTELDYRFKSFNFINCGEVNKWKKDSKKLKSLVKAFDNEKLLTPLKKINWYSNGLKEGKIKKIFEKYEIEGVSIIQREEAD